MESKGGLKSSSMWNAQLPVGLSCNRLCLYGKVGENRVHCGALSLPAAAHEKGKKEKACIAPFSFRLCFCLSVSLLTEPKLQSL